MEAGTSPSALLFDLAETHRQLEGKRDKGERKLIEQGHRAYNLGRWSDALAAFEKAYEDSGDWFWPRSWEGARMTTGALEKSDGGATCPAGSETCACTPNQTCNIGLACYSNRCVQLPSGGGGAVGAGGAIAPGSAPG